MDNSKSKTTSKITGLTTADAVTNNFYNKNMELNMNKSYSHTINTNENVGNTTTSVGTKTTAKADSVNSNNKHKEMDMSNNNVTKGEQLEKHLIANGLNSVKLEDVGEKGIKEEFIIGVTTIVDSCKMKFNHDILGDIFYQNEFDILKDRYFEVFAKADQLKDIFFEGIISENTGEVLYNSAITIYAKNYYLKPLYNKSGKAIVSNGVIPRFDIEELMNNVDISDTKPYESSPFEDLNKKLKIRFVDIIGSTAGLYFFCSKFDLTTRSKNYLTFLIKNCNNIQKSINYVKTNDNALFRFMIDKEDSFVKICLKHGVDLEDYVSDDVRRIANVAINVNHRM